MDREMWPLYVLLGVYALFLIALVVASVLYLLAIYKLLKKCSPESRAMEPAMVWLAFVPLFNLYWQFMIVINVAKTLDAEFKKRNINEAPMPGRDIGLAMCILGVISIIPYIGILTGIAGLVCFIIYWVKINGYSRKLGPA
ncbi:MAG: hypothetical protein PHT59_05060 [Candidatus Omnitrophica bacterium]|nr:hypothetical protein [Candidatus Omnitrophota bacterium]